MKNTRILKSGLLMAAATATAFGLASCSSDEPIEENHGAAISFRPSLGTRATETTNANLTVIDVAAFMGNSTYFSAMPFKKGTDGFFDSSTVYNWPGDNSELQFYAYSPENPGGTITLTPQSQVLTGFSPASDIASQVDFITATATGRKSTNESAGVPLTFEHRLAQIEVVAKTDNEAYTYKVSGVRIGQPVSQGDFNFADNTWTLASDKAIYEETYTDTIAISSDPVSVMGKEGSLMLIPQQLTAWDPDGDGSNTAAGAYLSIRLQIKTKAGAQVYPFASNEQCQWAAIPISTNWEAGKRYVYVLDLTHGAGNVDPKDPTPGTPILGGPIKFTVNVTDWVDSNQDTPMNTGKDS